MERPRVDLPPLASKVGVSHVPWSTSAPIADELLQTLLTFEKSGAVFLGGNDWFIELKNLYTPKKKSDR